MTENQKIAVKESNDQYKTALVKQSETFTNMLSTSFESMNLKFSEYKKVCALNCISKMDEILRNEGIEFRTISTSNVTQILQQVSMLELNMSAFPRECYLQLRKVKQSDGSYARIFEFGIEGNGNDALLRKYGVDLKDVKGPYVVREGDEFTFPYFDGEKMVPPTWHQHSSFKKPVKVFYILTKKDDSKEYLISEREEVVKNLQAHIANNLMWASDNVKKAILDKVENMTLEEILADKSLRKVNDGQKVITVISNAWSSPSAREDMIMRKMKNNAIKKYPKDFSSSYIASAYEETFEDYDLYRKEPPVDAINVEEKVNDEADNLIGSEKIVLSQATKQEETVPVVKPTEPVMEECPI